MSGHRGDEPTIGAIPGALAQRGAGTTVEETATHDTGRLVYQMLDRLQGEGDGGGSRLHAEQVTGRETLHRFHDFVLAPTRGLPEQLEIGIPTEDRGRVEYLGLEPTQLGQVGFYELVDAGARTRAALLQILRDQQGDSACFGDRHFGLVGIFDQHGEVIRSQRAELDDTPGGLPGQIAQPGRRARVAPAHTYHQEMTGLLDTAGEIAEEG